MRRPRTLDGADRPTALSDSVEALLREPELGYTVAIPAPPTGTQAAYPLWTAVTFGAAVVGRRSAESDVAEVVPLFREGDDRYASNPTTHPHSPSTIAR
jgi:hypothetical protein